jgi:hypothetical protein
MAVPTRGISPACRSCRVVPWVSMAVSRRHSAGMAVSPTAGIKARRAVSMTACLLTASGNFKPEHRDGGGVSLSRMSQALQPSSVNLHVFGDPFDAHELKLLLGLPCAARITETVKTPLSSVHRLAGARQVCEVVLGTFTAPFTVATACLLAPYPETCLHPISAGRSKYTQSLKHASPGMGRRQPTPNHTLPLETCRERASHCTSVSELIKTPPHVSRAVDILPR